MQSGPETLLVRQHERIKCRLPVQLSTAPLDAERVRLALTLGDGGRSVAAELIDWSPGGLGIRSSVFFPKSCRILARVTEVGPQGLPGACVFEGVLRVQRTSMIGSEPTYYLGASFADAASPESMASLMNAAKGAPPGERSVA